MNNYINNYTGGNQDSDNVKQSYNQPFNYE